MAAEKIRFEMTFGNSAEERYICAFLRSSDISAGAAVAEAIGFQGSAADMGFFSSLVALRACTRINDTCVFKSGDRDVLDVISRQYEPKRPDLSGGRIGFVLNFKKPGHREAYEAISVMPASIKTATLIISLKNLLFSGKNSAFVNFMAEIMISDMIEAYKKGDEYRCDVYRRLYGPFWQDPLSEPVGVDAKLSAPLTEITALLSRVEKSGLVASGSVTAPTFGIASPLGLLNAFKRFLVRFSGEIPDMKSLVMTCFYRLGATRAADIRKYTELPANRCGAVLDALKASGHIEPGESKPFFVLTEKGRADSLAVLENVETSLRRAMSELPYDDRHRLRALAARLSSRCPLRDGGTTAENMLDAVNLFYRLVRYSTGKTNVFTDLVFLTYMAEHGDISNADAVKLCGVGSARYFVRRCPLLEDDGYISGRRREINNRAGLERINSITDRGRRWAAEKYAEAEALLAKKLEPLSRNETQELMTLAYFIVRFAPDM